MRDPAHGMQQRAKSGRVLALARELPIVRARDVEGIGISARLHRAGQLERVGRGLYRLPNSPVTECHNFALVASRIPQVVIYLSFCSRLSRRRNPEPIRGLVRR